MTNPALPVCLTLIAATAWAQPGPLIDEATGRDLLNYPPPVHFDFLHVKLELDIPDMTVPHLTARETLSAAPVGRERGLMRLNAAGMAVRSVTVPGRSCTHAHEGGTLEIRFEPPALPGQPMDAVIEYELDYPANRGAGLTWTPGREKGRTLTDLSPQIHTQGQPESNRTWFPCHDFPNDRLSSEMIITTEAGYDVCANGRLVLRSRLQDGRERWHWLQEKSHPAYLIAMVIGKFDVVRLGGPGSAKPDLPMALYAPVGQGEELALAFARTPDMIAAFERIFDEPFHWDKYHQLLVRNFQAGAMENTGVVTFHSMYAGTGAAGAEGTIAHELAHHWFGDLVGYKSWEHLWLGEGWASFGEALWAEASAEPGDERRAYQRQVAGFFGVQRGGNRTSAPAAPGMVSRRYIDPDFNFTKGNNVYSKGALVLHMLRIRLGDEAFFKGVRLYLDRFRFRQVETDDFRRCLEEVSGESLDRFFEQWAVRPGLPRLRVVVAWDEAAGVLSVNAEQTQTIDADNPAYAMVIPVYVKRGDSEGTYVFLPMDARAAEGRFPLDGAPTDVIVDPNMSNAAPASVEKPFAMWIEQLRHESVFAQAQAVEHLAVMDGPSARAALAAAAADGAVDRLARRLALEALASGSALAGAARADALVSAP